MSIFFKKQPKIRFKSQEEVTAYWKKEGVHRLQPGEIEDMLKLMVDDVTFRITSDFFTENLGHLDDQAHILDAGCGWGRSLIGLRRRYPRVAITGIDITQELLDLGKSIAVRVGADDIRWQREDLTRLTFPGRSFSHIISTRCLHYIVEPERAIRELVRVLRPGGRMIILVPNKINPLLFLGYHTKLYSATEMAAWFDPVEMVIEHKGSIGFVPPFRLLRHYVTLARLEPWLRRIIGLNKLGGLAYVIASKRAI